jgi:copper chaperone CopZ
VTKRGHGRGGQDPAGDTLAQAADNETETVTITTEDTVDDEKLHAAIEDAGYDVAA